MSKEKLNEINNLINEKQKGVSYDERESTKFTEMLKETLKENFKARDFKNYTLVNNWGFTFMIDNEKYDCRYWANSYGCYLGYWDVM